MSFRLTCLHSSVASLVILLQACGGGGTDASGGSEATDEERESPAHIVHDPAQIRYQYESIGNHSFHGSALNALGHVAGTYDVNNDPEQKGAFLYDGRQLIQFRAPHGHSLQVEDMNRSDRMVGSYDVPKSTGMGYGAFTWSRIRGFVPIAPSRQPGVNSSAEDVNDAGQVVGTIDRTNGNQGFLWSLKTGLVTRFGKNTTLSHADRINNGGIIAGATYFGGEKRAVLVNSATGERKVVTPPLRKGGTRLGSITHLNEQGDVAGIISRDDRRQAFFSSAKGANSFVDFGKLVEKELQGQLSSEYETLVTALGDKGEVFLEVTPHTKSYLWTRKQGLVEIRPQADEWSLNALNKHGVAVGWTDSFSATRKAMIWSKKAGPLDLTAQVDGVPADHVVHSAQAINEKGQILAHGDGTLGTMLLTPITKNGHAGH